jgi:hypothetical protein
MISYRSVLRLTKYIKDDDRLKDAFVAGEEHDAEDDLPRHDKVPNLKLVMNPEGKFFCVLLKSSTFSPKNAFFRPAESQKFNFKFF